MLRRNSKT